MRIPHNTKHTFKELSGRTLVIAGTIRAGEIWCADNYIHPRDPKVMIITPDAHQKLKGLRLNADDKIEFTRTMHLYKGPSYKLIALNIEIKLLISTQRKH